MTAITLNRVRRCGLVTAVRVEGEAEALAGLEALLAGGIDVAEIAMSMPGGVRILESAARRFGDAMLLGAGTVLDAETARQCLLSGARFLVSPSLALPVVEMGCRYSAAVFCGALTPTEVVTAWSAGAHCVKVFPAKALGGPQYIRSLKTALPQVELMPMGGVSLESAGEYMAAGSFALGVGSDLVAPGVSRTEIEARARAFKTVLSAMREAAA